jgi:hypothetical protein
MYKIVIVIYCRHKPVDLINLFLSVLTQNLQQTETSLREEYSLYHNQEN